MLKKRCFKFFFFLNGAILFNYSFDIILLNIVYVFRGKVGSFVFQCHVTYCVAF